MYLFLTDSASPPLTKIMQTTTCIFVVDGQSMTSPERHLKGLKIWSYLWLLSSCRFLLVGISNEWVVYSITLVSLMKEDSLSSLCCSKNGSQAVICREFLWPQSDQSICVWPHRLNKKPSNSASLCSKMGYSFKIPVITVSTDKFDTKAYVETFMGKCRS